MDETITKINKFKNQQNKKEIDLKEKIRLSKEQHLLEINNIKQHDDIFFDKKIE